MNKKCGNCGESEFYSHEITLAGDAGALLPVGFFRMNKARVRVCGHCGLMDLFASPESLAKVREKFSKESSE
jgi:ribosomal protein S27AE